MPEVTVKDFTGREITPGCVVAYPVRRGSKMWMTILNVTQLSQDHASKPVYLTGYNRDGRKTNVYNTENCVLISEAKSQASNNENASADRDWALAV